MIGITILGATGTIGVNTLDVIARMERPLRVHALTGQRNVERMYSQCMQWQPAVAVMGDPAAAFELQRRLQAARVPTEVRAGPEALCEVASASEVDYVMAGIVGAAGLLPNLAAARAGKRVMLANKESLVMSGELFMQTVRASGAELLPIDSEHNAIFQCLPPVRDGGLASHGVRRILLTASGGPFRTLPLADLAAVTPEQACAHPNWVMGRKISVDSATMMNKGLEIIEACWLFGTALDDIEVVIHPQSVIHSMVEYVDGSVLAQLGNPDMRTPIAYALGWPARVESGVERLNLFDIKHLSFERPDEARFPCLPLARAAMRAGGTAGATLNGANEEAVRAFLAGEIRFTDIPRLIEAALDTLPVAPARDIETVLDADQRARACVRERIAARTTTGA